MTLEEKIRAAIASDEGLQHLTLAPTEGGWQAAYRRKRSPANVQIGYKIAINADPIAALLEVLGEPGPAAPDLDEDDLSMI